jgi:hypothetical protein
MPKPFTWQYFILSEDGKSYNFDTDIEVNDTPIPIKNTPDGWQDKLVNFGRNTKYFGIFRSFTIPLKFVTEGKKVLRSLCYNSGIEKVASLFITKLNNAWTYDPYFTGEIDFSKFEDDFDFCTVNIMEGGLAKQLTAKEGTAYEIPVDGPGVIPVRMPGIELQSTLNYVIPELSIATAAHTVGVQYVSQEGTSIGVVTSSSPLQSTNGFDPATNNDRFIIYNTEQVISFKIEMRISFGVSKTSTMTDTTYRVYFKKSTGAEINVIPTTNIANGEYVFNINQTVTLAIGEKLFLIGQRNNTGFGSCIFQYHTSDVKITFRTSSLPTSIKTRPASDIFKQLISKMTDNKFVGESDLLDNRSDLVITCGDAIRSLPNAVIKTTFSDFHKSFYSILSASLGLDNDKAKMEEMAYFFDNSILIAELGEIRDLKVTIAEDLIYNSVKVGYLDQKYDDVNGKDEFNSTQVYQLPITRIAKEWDLISPYRADSYGIEFTRANLTDKQTTDNEADNDVFVMQVEEIKLIDDAFMDVEFGNNYMYLSTLVPNQIVKGVKIRITGSSGNDGDHIVTDISQVLSQTLVNVNHSFVPGTGNVKVQFYGYVPKKGPYDSLTGVINQDVFNVELSPKRCLLAHGNYLHSITDHLDTKSITFQSALKNAEMVASIGGVSVTEKADVSINTLPAKLFLPYYFTFDCQVPIDLVDLMAISSRGYFSFKWLGNTYKGFPIDISIKPADNDVQEFKLLACPDNDMSKLV